MATLLVVEDDRPTHALFVALVNRCGCEASSAFDGRAALRKVRGERPDGMILDLLLPEMNGVELLEEIDRFAPQLISRTIVITAASDSLFHDCAQMRYVRCLMRKPFNIEQLEAFCNSPTLGQNRAARYFGRMRGKDWHNFYLS